MTSVIEHALKNVKGVDFMSSTSGNGFAHITLFFHLTEDLEIALNDVRSKISETITFLPKELDAPSISKMDTNNFPSIWISVSSDSYNRLSLTSMVQNNVLSVFNRLNSVGKAILYGGEYYSMLISPDPVAMYQYRLNPEDLESAVVTARQTYPIGNIKTPDKTFNVKAPNVIDTEEDFAAIVLKKNNRSILRLGDVAKVQITALEQDVRLRYNGKPATAVGLILKSKSNVIDLSNEVQKAMPELFSYLPPDVHLDIAYDAAKPVRASIKGVFWAMFEALILVSLVTYVFFRSIKTTIIPIVTIPISLICTFIVMYWCNFSINTFTMLAMILAIGLVVDDAIVMLENIIRHRQTYGCSFVEAAMSGSKEINFVIIATTLTLASVFLPIGFVEGFVGKLFIEFAWTLAFCVLFSGFTALTLTPMMCVKLRVEAREDSSPLSRLLDRVQFKYRVYLTFVLKTKGILRRILVPLVILSVVCAVYCKKSFVPQEDDGFLQISFTGPEGSSLEHSEKSVVAAEQILMKFLKGGEDRPLSKLALGQEQPKERTKHGTYSIHEVREDSRIEATQASPSGVELGEGSNKSDMRPVVVKSQSDANQETTSQERTILGFFTMIGADGPNTGMAFVPLTDWEERSVSQSSLKNKLNQSFSKIPGMSIFATDPMSIASVGASAAVEFNLETNKSFDSLNKIAQLFVSKMKESGIFQNIDTNYKASFPTIKVLIDQDKAFMYGVDKASVARNLRYMIGGKSVGYFSLDNGLYEVVLRYDKSNRNSVNAVGDAFFQSYRNNTMLSIGSIADLRETIAIESYYHYNNANAIRISADLTQNGNVSSAIEKIRALHKEYGDDGYSLRFVGEIKRMQESNANIAVTFLLALVFIYLILSAQFESFKTPLLILATVPFALIGAFIFLFLFQDSLNMYSNIGMVTLIGLVTKNAIMIVEFADHQKSLGLSARRAVVEAAQLRLRPILMTSIATALGALPLQMASGAGAGARHSIGTVIVGGMTIGTLLTLFVVPVLYERFRR